MPDLDDEKLSDLAEEIGKGEQHWTIEQRSAAILDGLERLLSDWDKRLWQHARATVLRPKGKGNTHFS